MKTPESQRTNRATQTYTVRAKDNPNDTVMEFSLTDPMRLALAVIAAVRAQRVAGIPWPDEVTVPRAKLSVSTARDHGYGWTVSTRSAAKLQELGLVKIMPRFMGATELYRHATLTELGVAFVAQHDDVREQVDAVGLGSWTTASAGEDCALL